RRGERRLERVELLVDRDPQGLEDALRRMALAEAGRRRDRRLDRVDQVGAALERLSPTAPDDRTCDLPRVALLAVAPEDRLQLALARLVDDVRRSHVLGLVHAHVE